MNLNPIQNRENTHRHPSYLTFVKGAVGMMLNPEGTQSVFDLEDGLAGSKSTDELLRFTRKDPCVRGMIEERYLQGIPNTEKLSKLPKDTLGYGYFNHLNSQGFDPDYYRKIDVRSDTDYVMMRIRQTHDIWHVITGFDTHALGEIALKAVELAQTHRPMAAAICAGGVFRYMVKQPEEFPFCIESIVAGYHLGLRANPLLGVKWEERWNQKVEDIREELNVEVLGPRGGQLTVDFSPKSALDANKEAHIAIGDALQKYSPAGPGDET